MNTSDTTPDPTPTDDRPLGFWLRVVEGLLAREFATAFADIDIDRRDWMLLNAVAGDIKAPWITDRIARGGKRVRALADRGWITRTDDGWTLTDEGRAEKERLATLVDGLRSRVAGAVSPEDYATTLASLEAIARELGWDEADGPAWRGRGFGRGAFGPGRGFGPGAGFGGFGPRGFGPGFRPGFAPGFGPHHGEHGHGNGHEFDSEHDAECGRRGHRGHRGHGRGSHEHRSGERAYERGFDAGFARGREAAASHPAA